MPRYPEVSCTTRGLSERVFGNLGAKARTQPFHPLHVGDTYLLPIESAWAERQTLCTDPALHRYAPVQGVPELLAAVTRKIHRRSGVRVPECRIQIMAGATAGLGVICAALLQPGDEVLLPAPFWPLIRGLIGSRGAVPVQVPLFHRLGEAGFDPVCALEAAITERTVAIYLNSPHNPTGAILPKKVAEGIGELAAAHDLWVLSDEVYEDLYFGPTCPQSLFTMPMYAERTIAVHSVSKAYGLAGARIGYCHGPKEVMDVIRSVQTFYTYCAATPMQWAATRALNDGDDWLQEARATYRSAAAAAARGLGLDMPEAGTFLFFDTRPFLRRNEDCQALLARCLEAGVMLTPGGVSGEAFSQWARLCFTAVPPTALEQALSALNCVFGHGAKKRP